jgi:hypothetical protein
MSTKHTPGPWEIVPADKQIQIHAKGFKGSLALIDWSDERANADARLIAAAPELLDQCKDALTFMLEMVPLPKDHPRCMALRAAIAKATGGEQ